MDLQHTTTENKKEATTKEEKEREIDLLHVSGND